jgi:hypothetical protein
MKERKVGKVGSELHFYEKKNNVEDWKRSWRGMALMVEDIYGGSKAWVRYTITNNRRHSRESLERNGK